MARATPTPGKTPGPVLRALARTRRAAEGSKGELFAAAWAVAAQQAYLIDEATKAYDRDELSIADALKSTNVAAPTLSKMLGELGAMPARRGPGRPAGPKPEPQSKPAAPDVCRAGRVAPSSSMTGILVGAALRFGSGQGHETAGMGRDQFGVRDGMVI